MKVKCLNCKETFYFTGKVKSPTNNKVVLGICIYCDRFGRLKNLNFKKETK